MTKEHKKTEIWKHKQVTETTDPDMSYSIYNQFSCDQSFPL